MRSLNTFAISIALLLTACVIDAPESSVSRFEVAWELAGGVTCQAFGAERVRLQSTLRSGLTPEVFADEFACEDGQGRTRPLEPGPYEVQLVAIGVLGDTVGLSEVRGGIELANEVTVELEPFTVDPSP